MSKIPVALELYSVRNELSKDLRGTLKAVAKMGYTGVEFAGPPQASGKELRAALDEVGLVCCSWHTPFESVQESKLAETIALNQAVGNRSIIIPGIPGELLGSKANWLKMAGFFNQLSEKLGQHGMLTGYHNHHTEFLPLDGEKPWDTFLGNTHKEVVMQLDLGNAMMAGEDVISILKQHPGRSDTIHLKPYSKKAGHEDPEAGFKPLIGEDDIPWKEVFHLCETTGKTRWYIVEYESDAYPPLEAVDRCLKAVKKLMN
jgi:sugar phosphate isomerase/epimerase